MSRCVLFALFSLAVPLAAQTFNLDFSALAAKAKSKTEIKLDGAALDAARKAVPEANKLPGVDAISIHNYEYAKPGEYPKDAFDGLRKQVESDSRWSRVLSAHEDDESTDIYILTQNGKVAGFLLIALEPTEVSVIQAMGTVQLANLKEVVESAIQYDIAALAKGQGK